MSSGNAIVERSERNEYRNRIGAYRNCVDRADVNANRSESHPEEVIRNERESSSQDVPRDARSAVGDAQKERASRSSEGESIAEVEAEETILSVFERKGEASLPGPCAGGAGDDKDKIVEGIDAVGSCDSSAGCGTIIETARENNSCENKGGGIAANFVAGEEINFFCLVRKRLSPSDASGGSERKKLKTDSKGATMNNIESRRALKIESELEIIRRSTPFKRRDIETIMGELELISGKWKEAYAKYKFTTKWDATIVKNCSEKWDSQYVPPKILERYHNYCDAKSSQGKSERFADYANAHLDAKFADGKSNQTKCGKGIEMGSDCLSNISENEKYHIISGSSSVVDDFNSYNSDHHGKMTLRSRQQIGRNRLDDAISYDHDAMDHSKEKLPKKSGKGNRDKKFNSSKRKPLELDRCKVPVIKSDDEGNLDSNKNFESELEMDLGHSTSANAHHYDGRSMENMRSGSEDLVGCPICGKKFQQQLIENHATECASAYFKD